MQHHVRRVFPDAFEISIVSRPSRCSDEVNVVLECSIRSESCAKSSRKAYKKMKLGVYQYAMLRPSTSRTRKSKISWEEKSVHWNESQSTTTDAYPCWRCISLSPLTHDPDRLEKGGEVNAYGGACDQKLELVYRNHSPYRKVLSIMGHTNG